MTWIDCRDCLPEESVSVLVYAPRRPDDVWIGFRQDEVWYLFHRASGLRTGRVTHWQPLPDPPEGVDD